MLFFFFPVMGEWRGRGRNISLMHACNSPNGLCIQISVFISRKQTVTGILTVTR
jgi:hypothetical protein